MKNRDDIKEEKCIYVIEKEIIRNINNFNLDKREILVISPKQYNNQLYYQLVPININKTIFYVKDYIVENFVKEYHLNRLSDEAYHFTTLCTDYILIDQIYKYFERGNLQIDFKNIIDLNKEVVYLEIKNDSNTCAWSKLCTQKSYEKTYIQHMVNITEMKIKSPSIRFKPY